MSALFPSEVQMLLNQSLHDKSISDLGPEYLAAVAMQDLVQTEVAHHGGDQSVLLQPISGQQIDGRDGQKLIAIQGYSVFVTKEKAVSIPIVGNAKRGARVSNMARESCWVGATAFEIDIEP